MTGDAKTAWDDRNDEEQPRTLWQRLHDMVKARRHLRNSELFLILTSAVIGGGVGLGVVVLHEGLYLLQKQNFALPTGAYLGENVDIPAWRILAFPILGGLLVGLLAALMRRVRPHEIIDPVEANALYGGRMSLIESIRLAVSTLLSSGFGASVGMEAAYTQVGSGVSSTIGQALHLRRGDLRILVGAGAAAAIAAAFNAPLAGAFYAFELVIGSYSLAAMAPVAVAAVSAMLVARQTLGVDPIFTLYDRVEIGAWDYPLFVLIGLAAGVLGILTMKAVTATERWIRCLPMPVWMRPALGGLGVGLIALVFPQVLGSGHGAIQYGFEVGYDLLLIIGLIVAKVIASAISLGSGFRGGLFSSGLFLGVLFGSAASMLVAYAAPGIPHSDLALALAGMGSVAAAIVGAPVTMVLLVLEVTADFEATVGVLIAVVTATILVRQTFGFSFATWRFHLRGVPIQGAYDIGWVSELRVGRLMRCDAHSVPRDLSLLELRRQYPLGSTKRVFTVDEQGHYAGIIDMAAAHDPDYDDEADEMTAGELAACQDCTLLPYQDIRTALKRFTESESEALAVVESTRNRRIIGYLTEAYALRRYNHELERVRSEELGAQNLFGKG